MSLLQRPLTLLPAALLAALAALLAALAALAACGGGDSSPTATPTATPAPMPATVTPAGPKGQTDLQRADRLYYEGAFEEAIAIYSAAANGDRLPQRQEGLFKLGRIQAQQGDAAAGETLRQYLDIEQRTDRRLPALLLLGSVEEDRDRATAVKAYEDYLHASGPAWPYARLGLARLAARGGDFGDAIEHAKSALLADLPPATRAQALFALAGYQESADEPLQAIVTYQGIVSEADDGQDIGEALWSLAEVANRSGHPDIASDALADLVLGYPWHNRALQALDVPALASNPAVGTRERGLVLFRNRINGDAAAAFQTIVGGGGPGVAEAQYYLGILAERAGDYGSALIRYDEAIRLLTGASNDTLLAQSMWDRATVLERQGLISDAIAGYAAVANGFPAHETAGEAGFRSGFLSYQQGLPADAAVYWTRYGEVAPDAEARSRANYWLSAAYVALGDEGLAAQYLQSAADASPLSYYTMRAKARRDGATAVDVGELSAPPVCAALARGCALLPRAQASPEDWLTRIAGPESTIDSDALFAGEEWLRALELAEAGMKAEADAELLALTAHVEGKPWLRYRLAAQLEALGRPWLSTQVAAPFVWTYADVPPAILRLVYPLVYPDLVNEQALGRGFSPALLLALMRQESLYDPQAVSIADASGLTQVIPSTAEEIAAQLGEEGFVNSDLLRPTVSIRFGAYYLGQQISGFGGRTWEALAAYNGGPGNAARWSELSFGDPDLFLEAIDFEETRLYVRLVLENYARYLYAYGYTAAPVLPL